MDQKKLLLVAAAAVLLFVALKKRQEEEEVVQNYSKAEGLAAAGNSIMEAGNNTAQNAINNATNQIGKLGGFISDWADRSQERHDRKIDNAFDRLIY